MKLALDLDQQNALYSAMMQMDTYAAVTPGVENGSKAVRVPYKLGAARRVLVKNYNAIKSAQAEFNESRLALFKEIWPDKSADLGVTEADDPANFARYKDGMKALIETKEEIELLQLPASVLYDSGNEFPVTALATLDELGLIAE